MIINIYGLKKAKCFELTILFTYKIRRFECTTLIIKILLLNLFYISFLLILQYSELNKYPYNNQNIINNQTIKYYN